MSRILPPFYKIIFSFLLSCFLYKVSAQVKFSAICPHNQIAKNEYLQVQYIVENASNVEQITPPFFKNFVVVSGPNQQSGMSSVNGNIQQFVALEYILKPLQPGNFTLDAATAKADGKTLRSNTLEVQVNNRVSKSSSGATTFASPFANIITDPFSVPRTRQYDDYILRKGENIPEKIRKNLFVIVSVDKTSCYVGEPVVATYKLYTRLKSESNLTKSPSFNGFSVSELEMPDNYSLSTEKYKGRDYSVYTLRKVQLYPLQPDTIELEPAEVENRITFLKEEYLNGQRNDLFYDMLREFADATAPANAIEEQQITLRSKPLNIVVKPLPDIGKPEDFKGAVGDFTITAGVKKKMTTDEVGEFIISIAGSGNIPMINAPAISWPPEIEAFDAHLSENVDKASVPLKGRKVFSYPFTVSRPGKYLIPPVTFSYFETRSQAYKTISTKPLSVEVKKGTGVKPIIASHLIHASQPNPPTFSNWLFSIRWFLLAAIFALGALVFWFIPRREKKNVNAITSPKDDKNSNEEEEIKIPETPTSPLLAAEEILSENNTHNFYPVINNCLRKYLSEKLNFPEKELSKKKINELLDTHNVSIGTTLLVTSLLENIELNLYAPPSPANEMREVYTKASEVISLLERQVT
jgi:hypothetical protein